MDSALQHGKVRKSLNSVGLQIYSHAVFLLFANSSKLIGGLPVTFSTSLPSHASSPLAAMSSSDVRKSA